MTSTGLLERISREDYQKGAPPQEPLNSLELLSNLGPTRRVQLPETLWLGSMMPHQTQKSHRDTIPSARSLRRQRKGHPSATGPLSMRISSPGRVSEQSFEPGFSQKSNSASISSRMGPQTPPMLLGRSSSHLAAQTSPLTSGSTLSRGLLSTLPKCWERTIPLMSRPSSPKTSATSPFKSPSSPKPSGRTETGSLLLGRPSKRSHSPFCLHHSLIPFSGNRTRPSHLTPACQSIAPSPLWFCLVWRPLDHIPHLIWCGCESLRWRTGPKASRQAYHSWREREPCHNWNQGTCHKQASECQYTHICDRSRCGGAHRRAECPKSKPQRGAQ